MRGRSASLSIGAWLLFIFSAVAVIVAVGLPVLSRYQQDQAVHRMALTESRRSAQLVFDHLYSVMRRGWTREELDEILARINSHEGLISVRVWRGPAVAAEYGPHLPSDHARRNDPVVEAALGASSPRLVETGDGVRYLYPLIAKAECLDCHVKSTLGEVNGVIDIHLPTDQLRAPLKEAVGSATLAYGLGAGLLFLVLFAAVRRSIARPIVELSGTMTDIVNRDDLGRRVTVRRLWPRELLLVAEDFNRLMGQLEDSREALLQQSVRDALTGVYNRRRFDSALRGELERARRYGRPLSVILVDLDRFKPINDRYGHAAGDMVLRAVANAMHEALRETDVLARIGGDEFAVLAPETGAAEAEALAQKLSGVVEALRVPHGKDVLTVGASCGPATLTPGEAKDATALLAEADAAMYLVKQERHERVGQAR